MADPEMEVEGRIDRLHVQGLVDLHFDLLMDLYEKLYLRLGLTYQSPRHKSNRDLIPPLRAVRRLGNSLK